MSARRRVLWLASFAAAIALGVFEGSRPAGRPSPVRHGTRVTLEEDGSLVLDSVEGEERLGSLQTEPSAGLALGALRAVLERLTRAHASDPGTGSLEPALEITSSAVGFWRHALETVLVASNLTIPIRRIRFSVLRTTESVDVDVQQPSPGGEMPVEVPTIQFDVSSRESALEEGSPHRTWTRVSFERRIYEWLYWEEGRDVGRDSEVRASLERDVRAIHARLTELRRSCEGCPGAIDTVALPLSVPYGHVFRLLRAFADAGIPQVLFLHDEWIPGLVTPR